VPTYISDQDRFAVNFFFEASFMEISIQTSTTSIFDLPDPNRPLVISVNAKCWLVDGPMLRNQCRRSRANDVRVPFVSVVKGCFESLSRKTYKEKQDLCCSANMLTLSPLTTQPLGKSSSKPVKHVKGRRNGTLSWNLPHCPSQPCSSSVWIQ
jgi:hypothetical protein